MVCLRSYVIHLFSLHCLSIISWSSTVHTIIPSHSYRTFIRRHSRRFLSSPQQLCGKILSGGSRAENLNRACLTKMSYDAPNLATLHPNWATPHPIEQRCTLMSYAAPYLDSRAGRMIMIFHYITNAIGTRHFLKIELGWVDIASFIFYLYFCMRVPITWSVRCNDKK